MNLVRKGKGIDPTDAIFDQDHHDMLDMDSKEHYDQNDVDEDDFSDDAWEDTSSQSSNDARHPSNKPAQPSSKKGPMKAYTGFTDSLAPSSKDPSLFGIYFRDQEEYDYMQHLKPIGEDSSAMFIAAKSSAKPERVAGIRFIDDDAGSSMGGVDKSGKAIGGISLPADALPSAVEDSIGLLNRYATPSGVNKGAARPRKETKEEKKLRKAQVKNERRDRREAKKATRTAFQDEKSRQERLGLIPELVESCTKLGFKHPTEIQTASIPVALSGRDIIGLAQTGSGKTAAFALPIIQSLFAEPQALYACVMAPTRELAFQISEQFEALGSTIGLRCAVIVGGMEMMAQSIALSKRPHVIVCTPGRLVDHLENTKGFNLKNLKYLVSCLFICIEKL
eukprot:jgi/Hompol1/1219/HPOL_001061-RA